MPEMIVFPDGLIGCPDWRRFRLIDDPDGGPVKLLQLIDEESIGLYVTDPYLVMPDYAVELGEDEAARIGLESAEKAQLFCVLTIGVGDDRITANLLGPIVINVANGMGVQVVQAEKGYTTKYPLVDPTALVESAALSLEAGCGC